MPMSLTSSTADLSAALTPKMPPVIPLAAIVNVMAAAVTAEMNFLKFLIVIILLMDKFYNLTITHFLNPVNKIYEKMTCRICRK